MDRRAICGGDPACRIAMQTVRWKLPFSQKRRLFVAAGLSLVAAVCCYVLLTSRAPIEALVRTVKKVNPDATAFKVDVHVIANNRPTSLNRLFDSLQRASPPASTNLFVHVEAHATEAELQTVEDFHWEHGAKVVLARVQRGGVVAAILESWYPASDDDVAIILEDDLSVSPYLFEWVYQFWPLCKQSQRCAGLGLHTPRIDELSSPKKKVLFGHIAQSKVYGQPIPCSWGAVWKPQFWRQLHMYAEARLDVAADRYFLPVNTGAAHGWKTSWKKYALELLLTQQLLVVYPNFENQTSIVTNHVEPGEHIKSEDVAKRKRDYEVPLLGHKEYWPETFKDMPELDVFFQLIPHIAAIRAVAPMHRKKKAPRSPGSGTDCGTHTGGIEKAIRSQTYAHYNKATVLLSHFYSKDRYEFLPIVIEAYCAAKNVDKVIVVWHNTKYAVPETWQCKNGKQVLFTHTYSDSLLNRFAPNPAVQTKYVINADDDMVVHPKDVDFMVEVAPLHPGRIVGPFPRYVVDGRYNTRTWYPRYELMLTKINVMETKYLYIAFCAVKYAEFRRLVIEKNNAEDIFMNAVVYGETGHPPALLYLPHKPVYDCGISTNGVGLHFRDGFTNERQTAVHLFKVEADYSTSEVYTAKGGKLVLSTLKEPPPDVGVKKSSRDCTLIKYASL